MSETVTTKPGERNLGDLFDSAHEQIIKMKGVLALLRSQSELKPIIGQFLTPEELGNVGFLLDDMLSDITKTLVDLCSLDKE
jgi:hypothetical protein